MNTITFTKVKLAYGWLGNMSAFPVVCEGIEYRTTEALFQALRFKDFPEIQEQIRAQKSPMAAKMIAKKHRKLISGDCLGVEDLDNMRLCLRLKVDQHPVLKMKLKNTGDAVIIEDCTARPRGTALFWGCVFDGTDWVGENWLGRLWMELRDELRS